MGMTIAEKIIAAAAGVDSVKPGGIHTVQLDRLMSNDGTTHLTVDMYKNKLNHPHIADTKKLVFIVDHNVPSDCPKRPDTGTCRAVFDTAVINCISREDIYGYG